MAWDALEQRLERQNAVTLQVLRASRSDIAARGLRPLVVGQALQIAIGVACLALFAPIWVAHRHDAAVLVAGLVLHAYFVGMIIVAAMVQLQIARIDFAAPVVAIQRQLLSLRKTYAIGGACVVGLPWWFLMAPLLVVLTRGAIMQVAPAVIWIQLLVGALGLLGTGWFYRWAHRPQRAALALRMDQGVTGASIRRAQTAAADIARFEQE
ncbi:MAG: hypothetical protein WDW36_008969 [Sanguina aurantia]